MAKMEVLQGRM